MAKPRVMQLVVTLNTGGAERLALTLLERGREDFDGLMAGLFGAPGSLEPLAQTAGIPYLALRADTQGKVAAVRHLSRALREHRISLLHIQAAYLLRYALPAAKLAGVPIIYAEHALHSLQIMRSQRLAVRLSAPFLNGIVCISEHIADYFTAALRIDRKRISVIHNGVDTQRFIPQGEHAALPWPQQDAGTGKCPFIFGAVARLCEAKDFGNLLRAFRLVSIRHPEARLLLAGDGEERPRLETLCAELALQERVHFAGMRTDVPELLRAMNIFVLSSRREGFPMAVLEAMACGIPVVSTTVGGIAGLNTGEARLRLVPPEDSEALADAMCGLLENAEERRALAEAALRKVQAEYSAECMLENYLDLYRNTWRKP